VLKFIFMPFSGWCFDNKTW